MASIIPGYEYDIFISYRQKDNKYDGWVTEFIDNLKREIEATFKEDVSIYFDENPHDGLLEIHNVDKSLETKLRSVIFMPIISQTYCDPKSFAWQNEFVAFNKIASADQLGRDVKLASGNVCSRIIPVKIHDLDASDTELIEHEMGCRLRAIDFIYSSSGVNRPLKPDDNPDRNLNKTFYRDQINKVANAIKDIIYGLHPDPKKRATKSYQTGTGFGYSNGRSESYPEKPVAGLRFSRKTTLFGSLMILLILAMILFIPKMIRNRSKEISAGEIVRKSIAVLPVSNLTGNPDLGYVGEGIQDDLTGRLGAISGFYVRPLSSTLQFKDSKETIQEIAKKLKVNTLIESSVKGPIDSLQIEVRLVEAFPEEKYIWSSSYIQNWSNIGNIYHDIISHVIDGTKIRLSSSEAKNLSIVQKHNPELLKAYQMGTFYMNKNTQADFEKGINYFNEARAIDPSDPLPLLGLARGYSNSAHSSGIGSESPNRGRDYALKALELDSTLSEAHSILGYWYLYTGWDFTKAEDHLVHAINLNPSDAFAHCQYGWYLTLVNRIDDAIVEMKKAIEIAPIDPLYQGYLAWLDLYFGKFDDALSEARKTLQLDPDYTMAYMVMGSAYAETGMHFEAIEMHKKGVSISPEFISNLGVAYALAGQRNEAIKIASELEKDMSENWWDAYGVAQIYTTLGDKDKAINALEIAFKLHGDFVPWMSSDPGFKALHNDQRFKDLEKKINRPI
jgi:tetratricopeptide (TPR) repeat protein